MNRRSGAKGRSRVKKGLFPGLRREGLNWAAGRMREPLERLRNLPYVSEDYHHILWWRDYADLERRELAQRAKRDGWSRKKKKVESADLEAALQEALYDTIYRQRLTAAANARNEAADRVREARSGVAGRLRRWGSSYVVRRRLARWRRKGGWRRMLERAGGAPLTLPSKRQYQREVAKRKNRSQPKESPPRI